MPRQYSTTGVSLATSTLGKPHLVGTGGASGFGTFDYESEGSTFPAKRMSTVHEALKELHEILMGDVESSESSESDSDEAEGEFEMEMEDEEERKEAGDKFDSGPAAGVGIRSGRRASMMAVEQARPGSVVSTSTSTSTSLKEKPSKGWRKGVARESVRFQLMVDVPCWEPGCYSGKSARALCDALPLTLAIDPRRPLVHASAARQDAQGPTQPHRFAPPSWNSHDLPTTLDRQRRRMGMHPSRSVHVVSSRTQRIVVPSHALALVLLARHPVEFVDERFEEDDRGGIVADHFVHLVWRGTEQEQDRLVGPEGNGRKGAGGREGQEGVGG